MTFQIHPEASACSAIPDFPACATKLAKQIGMRAEEAAAAATLTPDVVSLLESNGLFCMGLPRGLGGYELDPRTIVRTIENIAYADGSTAWAVAIGNSSTFFAWLDQEVATGILKDSPGQPVSSVFAPTGKGRVVDGGYRVSGRWDWASGSPHATMLLVGFLVVGPDGDPVSGGRAPVERWGVVAASDIAIQPTWSGAVGLRGSGSHTVIVDDVFVPADHTIMSLDRAAIADGALYRLPFFTLARSLLVGIPLGVARRALDELRELCSNKTRESMLLAHDSEVQIHLAEVEAVLQASRSFVLDMTGQVFAVAQQNQEVPLAMRTEYTLATQLAMRSAVNAVNLAFEVAGASSSLAGDTIQRCWRDVNVASQHRLFGKSKWRGAGKSMLGLPVDPLHL